MGVTKGDFQIDVDVILGNCTKLVTKDQPPPSNRPSRYKNI